MTCTAHHLSPEDMAAIICSPQSHCEYKDLGTVQCGAWLSLLMMTCCYQNKARLVFLIGSGRHDFETYRVSSKNSASLIFRHLFTQMGKIVLISQGNSQIFWYLISKCYTFSAACRPVREAYTNQSRREIGEFGAV